MYVIIECKRYISIRNNLRNGDLIMEKFFKVKEHGSTVRVEVLAGITTFMAMSYILMVNAGMFSALPEVSYNAIYIATALSAVVGTFAMAFLANLPLGLASGMGLNANVIISLNSASILPEEVLKAARDVSNVTVTVRVFILVMQD